MKPVQQILLISANAIRKKIFRYFRIQFCQTDEFLNLTVLNETQPHCDFSCGEMLLEINKTACFPQHNSFLVCKSIKLRDVRTWYLDRFLDNEKLFSFQAEFIDNIFPAYFSIWLLI